MTLLLGKVLDDAIIIMSDGLCRGEQLETLCDNLQKVFPVEKSPFAIAHHGQNVISRRPVRHILGELQHEMMVCTCIEDVAKALEKSLNQEVENTLQTLTGQSVGFWIAGPTADDVLGIVELFWLDDHSVATIKMQKDFVEGGDGKKFSLRVRRTKEMMVQKKRTEREWYRYLQRLYAQAFKLQPKKRLFGGKRHTLVLRSGRNRHEWIEEPTSK